jgi:hypothetical protein
MPFTENPFASPLSLREIRHKEFLHGLQAAAMGLVVISFIEFLVTTLTIFGLVYCLVENPSQPAVGGPTFRDGVISVLVNLACLAKTITAFFGALWMRDRIKYRAAFAGACASLAGLAFLPLFYRSGFGTHDFSSILLLLGAPFGAWSLIALLRKDTRAAFAEAK